MTQTRESHPRQPEGRPDRSAKPAQSTIPGKKHLRIGEVARIVGLPTSVLRFWETEFPRIKPKRTSSGQRLYHRDDIPLILKIKALLYDQNFTIKGARKHLADEKDSKPRADRSEIVGLIKAELKQIRDLLK